MQDASKARLVAQCDIQDNIDRIINFEYDDEIDASMPIERVNGSNEGIKHSFYVSEDLFAQGEHLLVLSKAR